MLETAALADIPAFRCAHAQDAAAGTGCTVIVAPEGAVCGVDVRGGGPATRETDLLKPENMVQLVHAVVLSGGSAFGLEASCGVMDALSERGIGFELAGAPVPIVTGACTRIPPRRWGARQPKRRSARARAMRSPRATWGPARGRASARCSEATAR